ncbi:hypothetical protein KAFR_0C04450 [Kazachstania africana CBS 2517]|uniref:Arrestin C-terminal-like domain-containing protein n=1 Tax=Kazachstania africana (strain ATCC 22294 / BCRC 22015 / CBS 2517 / CECT 1963 / NBRC 1671 / NRRL Y-8276) TaxID=1071382 RepID=H2AST6_KAZAF|nr:hypothetical protein KAFR_0C04450 [Kazachstania africana CBS 2517]CCF57436.1 hypothetical protein KAFR_0C04450 [Kazachstania africana CBS 2517]
MFSNHTKQSYKPLLFELRIHGTDNDVILIKGSSEAAPSVLLSGTIMLSIAEPIQIKNLYLKLLGRMKINLPIDEELSINTNGSKQIMLDKYFYQYTWDDFTIENYLNGLYDNYDNNNSISGNKLGKAKSTTSLITLKSGKSPKRKYHTLLKGNYEFPFSAILPGNMFESVEISDNASITYYLEAIIERSKGASDLYCRKYIRFLRTLAPDSVELSETVNVTDRWPNKVEYSISTSSKAAALGSTVPINIMLVPLLKGLSLHKVRIKLLETLQFEYQGMKSKQERIITKLKLVDPELELTRLVDDQKFQEKWEVTIPFEIPSSLSEGTPDCDIPHRIRVQHKIKISIYLRNEDRHISELRASLNVVLFVSPFVVLRAKNLDKLTPSQRLLSGHTTYTDNKKKSHDGEEDEVIFIKTSSQVGLANVMNNSVSSGAVTRLMTPPDYEKHIFDRIWTVAEDAAVISRTPSPAPFSDKNTPNTNIVGVRSRRAATFSSAYKSVSEANSDIGVRRKQLEIKDLKAPVGISSSNGIISTSPRYRKTSSFTNKNLLTVPGLNTIPTYESAVASINIDEVLPPIYCFDEDETPDDETLEIPRYNTPTSFGSENESIQTPPFALNRAFSHNSLAVAELSKEDSPARTHSQLKIHLTDQALKNIRPHPSDARRKRSSSNVMASVFPFRRSPK